MKKFYYSDGYETFGPFSFDELKEKNLTPDSFVWLEGLSEWKPAGTLPELDVLFSRSIPEDHPSEIIQDYVSEEFPDSDSPASQNGVVKHKSNKKILIILVLFLVIVGGAAGLYFSGLVSFSKAEKTFSDVNETLDLPEAASVEPQTFDQGPIPDYTGDPAKDVLLFARKQELFSNIAFDVARKGVIDDDDMKVLREAYGKIMKVYSLYPARSAGRKKFEELLAGEFIDISTAAEYSFLKAEQALASCKNYGAYEQAKAKPF